MRRKKRGRNLDDEMIEEIVQILDGWQGKITWALFAEKIEKRTGRVYSRQTLSNHLRIQKAYQDRRNQLTRTRPRTERSPESFTPKEVQALIDRNKNLTAENERLAAENERLLLQFIVWSTNASIKGLDEAYLNRSLAEVDRDATPEAS
ncbi:hypothetical protein [Halodesulfovibrio sp. MK-HDV]|jgi:hypothetical protein|uniref:hypothetical protein n=1 Tax=Halodesulfovibrio sp. MK-HDV TaxID=2599925 RepID=UPI00136BCDF4|nr:hypothetical protein [Halodesulfovibrio sp. MK-HDV]KAF1075464.1 hypothetical protein MKHDV_01912 [Halodesulfovibrio sp. MK-HDV]